MPWLGRPINGEIGTVPQSWGTVDLNALFRVFRATGDCAMALKPSTAKITDFETSFDAVPVASAEGEVIWADVRIDYILAGLAPTVTIRVPVPWSERDTPDERKSKALRCARQLIDHACRAAGVGAAEN